MRRAAPMTRCCDPCAAPRVSHLHIPRTLTMTRWRCSDPSATPVCVPPRNDNAMRLVCDLHPSVHADVHVCGRLDAPERRRMYAQLLVCVPRASVEDVWLVPPRVVFRARNHVVHASCFGPRSQVASSMRFDRMFVFGPSSMRLTA